ncbi:MAG: hypothetical protein ACR2N6_06185, partial [Miltoncostaeaceae bacterium]
RTPSARARPCARDPDRADTGHTRSRRAHRPLRRLDDSARLFDSVFTVAPLVLVGTRDEGGAMNPAPKHMAMP